MTSARPHILGALLDAAAQGLKMLPQVRLQRLPRLADFALWAAAHESAFRPAASFEAAHANNRMMQSRTSSTTTWWRPTCARSWRTAQWTGSGSDLLQAGTNRSVWPKNPRALAGRLRRAQTFLRTFGVLCGDSVIFNWLATSLD
jgi:hypothetical protein